MGPTVLEEWYKDRIAAEGRWRTFARILGDSGHSCSTSLHAEALATVSSGHGVWRYFFDIPHFGLPGATHCSETAYLEHSATAHTKAEQELEELLAHSMYNLAAHGDPNAGSSNSLVWETFSTASPKALMVTPTGAIMNTTKDTIRA